MTDEAEPEPAIANPEQQLAWEKRHRPRAGIASLVAAVGLLGFYVLQQVLQRDMPKVSGLKLIEEVQGRKLPVTWEDFEALSYADFLKLIEFFNRPEKGYNGFGYRSHHPEVKRAAHASISVRSWSSRRAMR